MTFKWQKDQITFLEKWWPHFGTNYVSRELNLSKFQIKSKVDQINMHMHIKENRLCIICKTNYQWIPDNKKSRKGYKCRDCWLSNRRLHRNTQNRTRYEKSWESLFNEIARTLRYRNKKLYNSNYFITSTELQEIYNKQNGKCFYSGKILLKPTCLKKDVDVISVDRYDSSGAYTPNNIVLCTVQVNTSKMDMKALDYISLCEAVYNHSKAKVDSNSLSNLINTSP